MRPEPSRKSLEKAVSLPSRKQATVGSGERQKRIYHRWADGEKDRLVEQREAKRDMPWKDFGEKFYPGVNVKSLASIYKKAIKAREKSQPQMGQNTSSLVSPRSSLKRKPMVESDDSDSSSGDDIDYNGEEIHSPAAKKIRPVAEQSLRARSETAVCLMDNNSMTPQSSISLSDPKEAENVPVAFERRASTLPLTISGEEQTIPAEEGRIAFSAPPTGGQPITCTSPIVAEESSLSKKMADLQTSSIQDRRKKYNDYLLHLKHTHEVSLTSEEKTVQERQQAEEKLLACRKQLDQSEKARIAQEKEIQYLKGEIESLQNERKEERNKEEKLKLENDNLKHENEKLTQEYSRWREWLDSRPPDVK